MKTLTILRGLPGSGKSTYAAKRWPGLTPAKLASGFEVEAVSVSVDHYYTNFATGAYTWTKSTLGQAVAATQCHLIQALSDGIPDVVVDNTHSRRWEYEVAVTLGEAFGYRVEIVDLFDGGCTDEELAERGTHGVPLDVIQGMRARWESGGERP